MLLLPFRVDLYNLQVNHMQQQGSQMPSEPLRETDRPNRRKRNVVLGGTPLIIPSIVVKTPSFAAATAAAVHHEVFGYKLVAC